MSLNPLIEKIRLKQPHLITPFIDRYFTTADQPGELKPYFYGRWSLKWVLHSILQNYDLTELQVRMLVHHIICELATLPNAPDVAQFEAITLVSVTPFREMLNETKKHTDITALPVFYAGNFKFVENNTLDNLTSLIFRKSNADGIVFHNIEIQSSGVVLRVNSRTNLLPGFKDYLLESLTSSEPGWKAIGDPPHMFINHGVRSKTPTSHTITSLREIVKQYFL